MRNLWKALSTLGYWRCVAYDRFRDEVMWCEWSGWADGDAQWRSWSDEDYTRARIQLEADGFEPVGRELLRDIVSLVARARAFDSAQTWLERLRWDGVERVSGFLETYCGVPAGGYAQAVSRYLWSALAGRVMVPGIKADMVPILVGEGGARKTTLVASLPPDPDFAAKIDLSDDDADNARKMRGTLAIEVAELRGLHSRDSESIKDFFSAKYDEWTPKYRELKTRVQRRCVFIGTTDNEEFLSDAVGNYRRWLPVRVGVTSELDVDGIAAVRDQLWAEAASKFIWAGIEWADAERLGRAEHAGYVLEDGWAELIEAWAQTPRGEHEDAPSEIAVGGSDVGGGPQQQVATSWACFGFTSREALTYGVGLLPTSVNRGAQMRAAQILKGAGFVRVRGTTARGFENLRLWTKEVGS